MLKILLNTNKDENKILRMKSEAVKLPLSEEDKALLDELYTYVKEHEGEAVGLSAIQVGVAKRMCAIRYNNHFHKLVNPKIIWHSSEKICESEGCLSVPQQYDNPVLRYRKIRVSAYDAIVGKNVIIDASNFYATIFQHEIDHMDGKLFIDYFTK